MDENKPKKIWVLCVIHTFPISSTAKPLHFWGHLVSSPSILCTLRNKSAHRRLTGFMGPIPDQLRPHLRGWSRKDCGGEYVPKPGTEDSAGTFLPCLSTLAALPPLPLGTVHSTHSPLPSPLLTTSLPKTHVKIHQ